MKKAYSAVRITLAVIFAALIIYLSVLSASSTSMMSNRIWGERTFFVGDSPIRNLLGALAFFAVFCAAAYISRLINERSKQPKELQKDRYGTACSVLLCLIGLLGAAFVLSSQRVPSIEWDQEYVQRIADNWINCDYSDLFMGRYLGQYPHQAGIILISYYLSFIFGSKNYQAFQLANVIALVAIYKTMGDISEYRSGKRGARLSIYLFGLLFFPGIMYTAFAYGNIIGLALSLLSFKYSLLFIDEKKLKSGIISAMAMLLAVIVKQNYLIFGAALVIYVLIGLLKRFSARNAVFALSMALILALSSAAVGGLVYLTTGQRLSGGISKWAWVTMGLMEDGERCNGWWNNHITFSYFDSGCDTAVQAEKEKKAILAKLKEFSDDPRYAVRFFSVKNASQWNNPNFQALWINQVTEEDGILRQPPWINYLLDDDGTNALYRFADLFHFIILAGALLHVFSGGIRRKPHELIYILAFIGGFVFHTVWEAKAQYALSYFWLLLPLSAEGYSSASERLTGMFKSESPRKFPFERTILAVCALALGVALLFIAPRAFKDVFLLDEDTERYFSSSSLVDTYLVAPSEYILSPAEDPSLALSCSPSDGGKSAELIFMPKGAGTTVRVTLSKFCDRQTILFDSGTLALDVPNGTAEAGADIWAYKRNWTSAQTWSFKRKDGNEYTIYHGDLVLAYSIEDDRVYLTERDGSIQQRWILTAPGADEP